MYIPTSGALSVLDHSPSSWLRLVELVRRTGETKKLTQVLGSGLMDIYVLYKSASCFDLSIPQSTVVEASPHEWFYISRSGYPEAPSPH